MAYARLGSGCDVYIFADVAGGVTCCGCLLDGENHPSQLSLDDMLEHLKRHREAGHAVPERLEYSLVADREYIDGAKGGRV